MKIVRSKDQLLEGILITQKLYLPRTTLPILQGILFDCRDHSLYIRATDLEIGIECRVEAEIVEKGWVVLDSRLLGEIVRKLPGRGRNHRERRQYCRDKIVIPALPAGAKR